MCPEAAYTYNEEHANIRYPVLWECEFRGEVKFDYGSCEKVGVKELTTIKIIEFDVGDAGWEKIQKIATNKYNAFVEKYLASLTA